MPVNNVMPMLRPGNRVGKEAVSTSRIPRVAPENASRNASTFPCVSGATLDASIHAAVDLLQNIPYWKSRTGVVYGWPW